MRLQKLSNYSNVKKKTMLEENHLYKNAKGIINIDRNEIKFKFLKASIFSISEKTTQLTFFTQKLLVKLYGGCFYPYLYQYKRCQIKYCLQEVSVEISKCQTTTTAFGQHTVACYFAFTQGSGILPRFKFCETHRMLVGTVCLLVPLYTRVSRCCCSIPFGLWLPMMLVRPHLSATYVMSGL